ncbi:uncharacterized protein RSE6_10096 [Rhynchosporium secalis]|uniref:Uncharacterized protein n=1 Tax=Rhynchosporium secalis TaxID=38038 RepID=A0A1E1MJJ4_RHYSE|nr:uncharacterized protein RSE6_10096 [Rhynchosporium secalis]
MTGQCRACLTWAGVTGLAWISSYHIVSSVGASDPGKLPSQAPNRTGIAGDSWFPIPDTFDYSVHYSTAASITVSELPTFSTHHMNAAGLPSSTLPPLANSGSVLGTWAAGLLGKYKRRLAPTRGIVSSQRSQVSTASASASATAIIR